MEATKSKPFYFKKFSVAQDRCSMKVGTDGVLLGAWADVLNVGHALDIGTGCGVIAIMLAQRTEAASVHAVEIEADSFEQAEANMQSSPWADRLKVYHTPVQEFSKNSGNQYDLIVSNPPFFSGGTFSANHERNQVRHTIKLPHGDLLSAARNLLSPEGRFCVILPHIEGLRFQELAEHYHLYCNLVTEVRPKKNKPIERLLLQFERSKRPIKRRSLVIQRDDNQWTKAYKDLTKAFYLDL